MNKEELVKEVSAQAKLSQKQPTKVTFLPLATVF